MIDWTDAAIEAALDECASRWRERYQELNRETAKDDMRAALDAAVKAQGCVVMHYEVFNERMAWAHGEGQEQGRADALEEAAKIADEQADECGSKYPSDTARMIAAAIRALKDKGDT